MVIPTIPAEAVIVLDGDLHVVYINPAGERLLGVSQNILRGTPVQPVLPPIVGAALEQFCQRVSDERETAVVEVPPFAREGSWLEASFVPFDSSDRRQIAVFLRDITERKRQEEQGAQTLAAAVERDRRWTELANTMPLMIWTTPPEGGTTTFHNQHFFDYTGLGGDVELPTVWRQVVHPDDLSEMWATRQRSIETGEPWAHEFRMRNRHAAWRWHLGRAVPTHGAKGEITGWVGFATDIHDLREAEAKRSAADERLKLALEASESGVIEVDCATGQKQYSLRTFHLLGIPPPKDILDTPLDGNIAFAPSEAPAFWSRLHPADVVSVEEALQKAYDPDSGAEGIYQAEYRVLLPDGAYCWIAAKGRVTFDAAGRCPVRLVGLLRNITDQKRAETHLQTLADTIPQLVWATHADGSRFYYNRRWYEYTGLTEEESTGFGFINALHPDDRERTMARWRQSLATNEPFEIEYRVRRGRDGAYRWFVGRAEPVRDTNTGHTIQWVGTGTDIHDQKAAETREAELRRELEHRISEFETLFAVAPVPLFVAEDPQGQVMRANPAALKALRFPTQAVSAASDGIPPSPINVSKSAPGDERPTHFRVMRHDGTEIPPEELPVQKAALTGTPVEKAEFEIVFDDPGHTKGEGSYEDDHRFDTGNRLRLFGHATPLIAEDGSVRGAVGAFIDVTEKTRLQEQQARVAAAVQRSLLLAPPPDAYPGLTVAPLYQSAWDEALIGGDFFDVFAVSENVVALVVGDATGKGVEAATYTAEIKFALRAFLREHNGDLPTAMRLLNEFVIGNRRIDAAHAGSAYVALTATLLNTQTGEAYCCCAGGEPPVILRAGRDAGSKTAEQVCPFGSLLGILTGEDYEAPRFDIEIGDLIAMTTDGITEARRQTARSDFFGIAGLRKALQAESVEPSRTLADIAKAVVERTLTWAGGHQSDDICLLLARRN